MRERTEMTIRLSLNLLMLLHSYEDIGKNAGMYELVEVLETNFHTPQRIVRALEEKNVLKRMECGRCISQCLIS